MDYRIIENTKHSDGRGELVVFLRRGDLAREQERFGQIYFITFSGKGVVRGNHYHKRWREWFGVVHGSVRVELADVRTQERISLTLSADEQSYTRLEIGPYVAHAFECLSDSASLLNYADDEWSEQDRFTHAVI